jgi:hypothetical protein
MLLYGNPPFEGDEDTEIITNICEGNYDLSAD